MTLSIPTSHLECLTTLNGFIPSHLKVAKAYFDKEKSAWVDQRDMQIDRESIASRAGVSLSTVRDFKKKYNTKLFRIKNKRKKDSFQYEPSIYYFNKHFFETLVLLEYNNYLHKWHEIGPWVCQQVAEDPEFLLKKTVDNAILRTGQLPTGSLGELPSLKSYLQVQRTESTKIENRTRIKAITSQKGFQYLAPLPLNFALKERLVLNYSPRAIEQAMNDWEWYREQHEVRSLPRLITSRIKERQRSLCK